MEKIFFVGVSVLLILVILLQQKNSSLGSLMGGDSGGEEIARSRQGSEQFLYRSSIVLAIALFSGALYAMFQ